MTRRDSLRPQLHGRASRNGADRETGLPAIGRLPWGSHASLFYESKADLLEVLIPFFKSGLENDECCLCVVSDPLDEEAATQAFRSAIPNADEYLGNGCLEILSGSKAYLQDGRFIPERVISTCEAKLSAALAKGHAGIRATGNESWLTREDWQEFASYETLLDNWVAGKPVIFLCTYPLNKASAAQLLDVARSHQVVVAKRASQWETLEVPALKQTKETLAELNKELELRVTERTQKLAAANAELIDEIADRRVAEKVVRENHELLRLVLETLPVGVAVVDPAGDISLINEASKRIWGGMIASGHERREQTKAYRHHSGERIDPAHWASARALSNGETTLNELIDIETYDGLRKIIRNSVAPIRDADGKVAGAVVVNEDVTDRIRAEEALRRSEDELRRVIDTVPVMAWTLRPDGVVDFLNQRWIDYAGLTLEQYVADPTGIIHPEDSPRVVDRWRAQMTRGEGYDDEMRLRRADGEYRWFLVRTSTLRDKRGNIVKWYGVSTDIEDRKQAEEALQHAHERLRILSRKRVQIQEEERRRLARELHDQVGQLLTAAKINVHSAASGSTEKLAVTIEILDTVLEQVRDISLALRPSVLDDLGLAPALRWMLSEAAAAAGVGADFVADPNLQRADAEVEIACYRVASEAVTNAIRHAKAQKIKIELRNADHHLRLTVRDDGYGFDVAQHEIGPTRERLGLTGMRERTVAVGGELKIDSEPGKGTELVALFPISPPLTR